MTGSVDLDLSSPGRVEAGVSATALPARGVPAGAAWCPPVYQLRRSADGTPDLLDGLDQLFLGFSADGRDSLGQGTVICLYQDAGGLAQSWFVHDRVQYLIVGRGAATLRQVSGALYAQVFK